MVKFSRRQIDGLAPTFSKKPAIRQEEDGKKLLFECRIQADPKPTVTWFHDGVIVKNTPRHKVNIYSHPFNIIDLSLYKLYIKCVEISSGNIIYSH